MKISTAEIPEEFDPVGRGEAVNLIQKKITVFFFEATTIRGILVPPILEFSKQTFCHQQKMVKGGRC